MLIKPPCCNTKNVPLSTAQAACNEKMSIIKPIYVFIHSYNNKKLLQAKLVESDNIIYEFAKFATRELHSSNSELHSIELCEIVNNTNADAFVKLFDTTGNYTKLNEIETFEAILETCDYKVKVVKRDRVANRYRGNFYPLIWRLNNDNTVSLYYDLTLDGLEETADSKKHFSYHQLEIQLNRLKQAVMLDGQHCIFYYTIEQIIERITQGHDYDEFGYGKVVRLSLNNPTVRSVIEFISSFAPNSN